MIGLIIVINKYLSQEILTFNFNSIDEAKNKLISILIDKFKNLNIDFPLLLSDLEYLWFNEESLDLPIFTYKIFDDTWTNPWDDQEIYSDVLDKLHEIEINTTHDSDLDDEPDEPDEPDEAAKDNLYNKTSNDPSYENNTDNDKYTELESVIKNIINNS